jgi:hypothetical protein
MSYNKQQRRVFFVTIIDASEMVTKSMLEHIKLG